MQDLACELLVCESIVYLCEAILPRTPGQVLEGSKRAVAKDRLSSSLSWPFYRLTCM